MRVAIMQPYYYPYAGYWQLFAASDVFVIYDDCQFPKGGWVHRNRFTLKNGKKEWLTLPLKLAPLGTQIRDRWWAKGAQGKMVKDMRRFPVFKGMDPPKQVITPMNYIVSTMRGVLNSLDITTQLVLSSSLPVDKSLKGQDRVLAICEYLKATRYINASGGTSLYTPAAFSRHGIELKFLSPCENKDNILERLVYGNRDVVRREIVEGYGFQ